MKHLCPNVNTDIYILPSDKFKTFSVSFKFFTQMKKETASLNAVFPFVLKSGAVKYPDMVAMGKVLEESYGGVFDAGVRKKGDIQEVDFFFEFLSPKFSDEKQEERCVDFIKEVLLNPLTENDGFKKDYTEREKDNLIDYIEGIINDKKEYTTVRLIEEMFEGEPYGIFESGSKDDVAKITPENLFNQYKKVINEEKLVIFITGDVDGEKIAEGLKAFSQNRRNPMPENKPYGKNLKEPKIVEEKSDTVQGKFGLGLKTGVNPESEDYFKLTLLNGVFGSGPTSKLFMNVREKMSLCYYVYSRLDRLKGIMTVFTGCDRENFQKAYDEILNQLNMCKKGEITEEEIENAKKFIVSILKQTNDSQRSIQEFYMTGILSGNPVTPEEYTNKILSCTKEDIVKIAENITMQTEFYLK